MKRPLAYITAAWRGEPMTDTEQAARYCRAVYDAGFSPLCPMLYLPLFLNDEIPEEHKSGIDMGRDLLRRSHVLVVVVLAGGGAAYYFKIYRPKQEQADTGEDFDEYEPVDSDPYAEETEDDSLSWDVEGEDK